MNPVMGADGISNEQEDPRSSHRLSSALLSSLKNRVGHVVAPVIRLLTRSDNKLETVSFTQQEKETFAIVAEDCGFAVVEKSVVEVWPSQMALTDATNCKPILATYGCFYFMGIFGYEPKNKIAFLLRLANDQRVEQAIFVIEQKISQYLRKDLPSFQPVQTIQLHLKGASQESLEIVTEAFEKGKNATTKYSIEILSSEIVGDTICFHIPGFAIDARTGEVTPYDFREQSLLSQVSTTKNVGCLADWLGLSMRIEVVYPPPGDGD